MLLNEWVKWVCALMTETRSVTHQPCKSGIKRRGSLGHTAQVNFFLHTCKQDRNGPK